MRLFFNKTHARGTQICLPVRTFGVPERRVYHRALGVALFGDSDGEYMRKNVP